MVSSIYFVIGNTCLNNGRFRNVSFILLIGSCIDLESNSDGVDYYLGKN